MQRRGLQRGIFHFIDELETPTVHYQTHPIVALVDPVRH